MGTIRSQYSLELGQKLSLLGRGMDKGVAQWLQRIPGYLMPTVVPTVPYLRRFRMGRKYLEVLTAKMMLGMRKKVHHPRQNQKAF